MEQTAAFAEEGEDTEGAEDLHAGKYSPTLEDPELSRITDEEMKTIMINASAKLAELLALRDDDPDGFAQLLAANWRQVRAWER